MKPSSDAAAPIAEDCEARSALLLGLPVVAKPVASSTYAVYYTDSESAIEIAEASVFDATVDVSAGSAVSAFHDAAFRVLNGPSTFEFSAEQGEPVPSRVRDALENEQFLQIHLQQLEQPRQAQPWSLEANDLRQVFEPSIEAKH